MKKILALLIALLLVFSLVGCETTGQLKDRLNARIPRGTIDGNVYTSEFTGITFTKPDRWSYLSDEEIAELKGTSYEIFDANYFEMKEIEYSSINDMVVVDNGVGVSVAVSYENLSLTVGKSISEKAYIDLAARNYQEQEIAKKGEAETTTLCGEDYVKAVFTYNTSDVLKNSTNIDMEITLYCRLIGDIMTVITITSPVGIIDRNVESMFS